MELNKIKEIVGAKFEDIFGTTPLTHRLDDIYGEAEELQRTVTFAGMKEEMGQLLCSCLAGCHELDLDPEILIAETLKEIEARRQQYAALGEKKKIGLYGGAFDPIHSGHIEAAKVLLDKGIVHEVWFMPAFQHLYNKKMESPEHRLKMVELACGADRRMKPFDYEVRKRFAGESFHCIQNLLREEFSKRQYRFYFVIGLDNALSFQQWINGDMLQRIIPFLVVPRKGYEFRPEAVWCMKSPHSYVTVEDSSKCIEVSSTDIRQAIHDGCRGDLEFVGSVLPDPVFKYICDNGLYGAQKQGTKK
jgi:nicotinate-nucleotide adenylyltransferase